MHDILKFLFSLVLDCILFTIVDIDVLLFFLLLLMVVIKLVIVVVSTLHQSTSSIEK